MKRLIDIIPDVNVLVTLEVEEIAGAVLQTLFTSPATDVSNFSLRNYSGGYLTEGYPDQRYREIDRVIAEAWTWLQYEGLLAPDPTQNGGWMFVTRKGQRLNTSEKFRQYKNTSALNKDLLHPSIPEHVWSAYLRGDFDPAVFGAFKALEVHVREICNFEDEIIGTALMRKAFALPDGPLAPVDLPKAEIEALSSLFAGAIGWFKNPQSHRDVKLGDSRYAVQSLLLASHLMFLADEMHSVRAL